MLDEVVETALAGRRRIALARLAALPPALARLVVVRLAEDAAGRLVPGVGGRVGELLALGAGRRQRRARRRRRLPRGGRVRRPALRAGRRRRLPPRSSWPSPGERRLRRLAPGGRDRRRRPGRARPPARRAPTARARPPRRRRPRPGGGLTVRGWRAGDRIAPLGLGGTKSLADLFTDRRIPRGERPSVPGGDLRRGGGLDSRRSHRASASASARTPRTPSSCALAGRPGPAGRGRRRTLDSAAAMD